MGMSSARRRGSSLWMGIVYYMLWMFRSHYDLWIHEQGRLCLYPVPSWHCSNSAICPTLLWHLKRYRSCPLNNPSRLSWSCTSIPSLCDQHPGFMVLLVALMTNLFSSLNKSLMRVLTVWWGWTLLRGHVDFWGSQILVPSPVWHAWA